MDCFIAEEDSSVVTIPFFSLISHRDFLAINPSDNFINAYRDIIVIEH